MNGGVTFLLTTRDRRGEAAVAIASCLAQDVCPRSVLVYDDGSLDDTAAFLRRRFPGAEVRREAEHRERLALRNRGMREAPYPWVAMLDDDCYFTDPATVTRALPLFADPSVAVVALPLVEPTRSRPPGWKPFAAPRGAELGCFLAGACLVRREAYLSVGGYRELLVHHQEERDLALRLMDRGWRFLYAGGPPLVHTHSGVRDSRETLSHSIRNAVLIPFLDFPLLPLAAGLPVTVAQLIRYRFQWRTLPLKLRGVGDGLKACWRWRRERRPVSFAAWRRFRRLARHGAEVHAGDARLSPCLAQTAGDEGIGAV